MSFLNSSQLYTPALRDKTKDINILPVDEIDFRREEEDDEINTLSQEEKQAV